MTTVVLTTRPVQQWSHGYDLRVANLCRQLAVAQHLVIVPLEDTGPEPAGKRIEADRIFESITNLGRAGLHEPRALRHLRLSEEHFVRQAHPEYFARAVTAIRKACRSTGADRMVVFGTGLTGIARAVGMRGVLFDVCDSFSLTLQRKLAFEGTSPGWVGRCNVVLALRRWRRCEGVLPHAFTQVTTINEADSEEIRVCAGGLARNVHTVPNGVSDTFLESARVPATQQRHGVAFWGNLEFAPNRDAMRYFFRQVYLPHLKGGGLEICVIGRGAEPWLVELARLDPKIRLLGYVDDLLGAIRQYPIMINPMRIGSGMKNKVVEAFAAGLAVVSTDLGMESIAGAAAGSHHLIADSSKDFAGAIEQLCADTALRQALVANASRLVSERYTWSAVGRAWRHLHDSLQAAADDRADIEQGAPCAY